MTKDELKLLIESDAEATEHFEAGRDIQCAERCLVIAPTLRKPVPGWKVQKIASMNGVWAKITLARESSETPDIIKGVCITILDWVRKDWDIDFDLPQVQMMMGGLLLGGIITQDEADEIDAAANTQQVISIDEVSACRQQ